MTVYFAKSRRDVAAVAGAPSWGMVRGCGGGGAGGGVLRVSDGFNVYLLFFFLSIFLAALYEEEAPPPPMFVVPAGHVGHTRSGQHTRAHVDEIIKNIALECVLVLHAVCVHVRVCAIGGGGRGAIWGEEGGGEGG